jgi:hypothetical protein
MSAVTIVKPKPQPRATGRKPSAAKLRELLDRPYLRNRVKALLDKRGVASVSPQKRAELGFNQKSWTAMLRNEHLLTQRQVQSLMDYFGLVEAADLFEPTIDRIDA